VHGLNADWPDEDCPKIFAGGLGDNPRQIKRTVNTFLMLWKLADKRKEKLHDRVKPIRLAKVVAIQTVYPELYTLLLKDEPRYLRELEEYYRAESSQERRMEKSDGVTEKTAPRVEPPPALVPFLSRQGSAAVKRILTIHKPEVKDANFTGLPIDDLKLYFTLTARAEAPQAAPEVEAARLVFEPQMVKIPAGKFLMGSTKEQAQAVLKETNNNKDWQKWLGWEQPQHIVELSEYFIGKHPITNREYQAFVRDAKYKPPQGWGGEQFPAEKGSHPVVNVSWDDASAYCKWLNEKTGKRYHLPTEAEWEKAARGEKVYVYPWGDDFDPKKANTTEAKIGDTSDVGKFSPQGDSPYGCADMAGNVWEWCHDWFNENEYKNRKDGIKDPQGSQTGVARVLHGGSFSSNHWNVRCAVRHRDNPNFLGRNYGFRVAFSSIPPL
jgi:formylglycine-generating enzyme required for sulfatase activity